MSKREQAGVAVVTTVAAAIGVVCGATAGWAGLTVVAGFATAAVFWVLVALG